jgi:hypothetical protein
MGSVSLTEGIMAETFAKQMDPELRRRLRAKMGLDQKIADAAAHVQHVTNLESAHQAQHAQEEFYAHES